MPPLPADSIHARACKLKCEKILTRPSTFIIIYNKYDSESWNVSRGNADMKIWFFIGHYNNFDTMTTEV